MVPRSACRVCGVLVGVLVGKKCPPHQAASHREKCPGTGQGTIRI